MVETNTNPLTDKTVCLTVVFHRPYLYRAGDKNKVTTPADKKMLRLSKAIVDSSEYRKMEAIANGFRKWLDLRSVDDRRRILGRGTRLVPIALLSDVLTHVDEVEAAYNSAADEFEASYPELVERATVALKDQFDVRNYPSARRMRAGCWVSRQVSDFGLPSEAKIGEALFRKELLRAECEWREAVQDVRYALREGFGELISSLVSKLEAVADGNGRALKQPAMDRVNEFLDLFDKRNITDDAELKKLVDKARLVLKGRKSADMRDSDYIRTKVLGGMAGVSMVMDKLLVDKPKRRMDFDDDAAD